MPHPSPLPRRPVLRPGLCVVRRDDRYLQVGVDPPHRLVVEDDPEVRRVLGDLCTGIAPAATPVARRLLTRLAEHGLLVDATELHGALGRADDRAAAAGVFAQHGPSAALRLAARAASRAAVDGPREHVQAVVRLLQAAGVGLAAGAEPPTVLVHVGCPEVRRDLLDPAVRAGLPHLVVHADPLATTVGPFVLPGVTACQRCVDAHRGETDPRRAMVVEQRLQEPTTGPEPRDPALLALALAWAVRDVVSYVDGDRPTTWSATVRLGPDPAPAPRPWNRHPHCGCSWGEQLATG